MSATNLSLSAPPRPPQSDLLRQPDGFRVGALVPVYNEAETLAPLLEKLRREVELTLVVDDGSTDGSAEIARAAGVLVHRRPNGGKGRALRSGFKRLLAEDLTHIITLDADGQHRPEDVPRFRRAALRADAALVIGSRLAHKEGYPAARRKTNMVGDWFISKAMGTEVEDAQSGYRLYDTGLLRSVRLHEEGFAIETELLIRIIRAGGRIARVPIPAIYDTAISSYFRPVMDTYRCLLAGFQALEDL
jgi:glycosyltransferase involved in cell wall biosynthesis